MPAGKINGKTTKMNKQRRKNDNRKLSLNLMLLMRQVSCE
jgi:hypothetical protein